MLETSDQARYRLEMLARVGLVTAIVLTACGGRSTPTSTTPHDAPPETPTQADAGPVAAAPGTQVRLIHAAIESREQVVTLLADGTATTTPTGYQFSSAYLALTPGAHEISARANDAELIGASLTFPEGLSTLVAYSTGDFPVALAMAADVTTTPAANTAQVRFFHAIIGQGPVDICLVGESARSDGTPIIANVAAGSLGEYATVAGGGELALQLRAQHGTPCHGRVIGVARFTPASESNYTLIFVGMQGRHRVAPELLFCADPPASDTSCATLAIDAR